MISEGKYSALPLRGREALLIASWFQHAFCLKNVTPFNEEMSTDRNGKTLAATQGSWIFTPSFLPSIVLWVSVITEAGAQEFLAFCLNWRALHHMVLLCMLSPEQSLNSPASWHPAEECSPSSSPAPYSGQGGSAWEKGCEATSLTRPDTSSSCYCAGSSNIA